MSKCETIIQVFVITAFWDVVLRGMSEGWFDRVPGLACLLPVPVSQIPWVKALNPYFAEHTVLGAAGIAGIIGVVTYVLMMQTMPETTWQSSPVYVAWVVFVISALVGIPMRVSGLFPHLNTHYYKVLGPSTTLVTDGMSGVVVAASLPLLQIILAGN